MEGIYLALQIIGIYVIFSPLVLLAIYIIFDRLAHREIDISNPNSGEQNKDMCSFIWTEEDVKTYLVKKRSIEKH